MQNPGRHGHERCGCVQRPGGSGESGRHVGESAEKAPEAAKPKPPKPEKVRHEQPPLRTSIRSVVSKSGFAGSSTWSRPCARSAKQLSPSATVPLRARRGSRGLPSREQERAKAQAKLDAVRGDTHSAAAEAQRLRKELEELRGERKQVRTRIEKLLGQMDQLSGS